MAQQVGQATLCGDSGVWGLVHTVRGVWREEDTLSFPEGWSRRGNVGS